MSNRPSSQYVAWLIAGTVCMVFLVAVVWHFRQNASPAQQLALKASRVDLVGQMQTALFSSSESEKSAVLAITDKDSQAFADQARAATAEVERERRELNALLVAGGNQREQALLAQFSEAFAKLQRIDKEVLGLAVKNTNLKAYSLLFGDAAGTLAEIDAALSRVISKRTDTPDAKQVILMAFGARVGVLRIQTLLAPHIAEESDEKMDRMEASMSKEEEEVRKDLGGLAAMAKLDGDADLTMAASRFAHYTEIKTRILALSRENTNVRSLALSLNQKRTAMVLCRDALNALAEAIFNEPIAGVTYGRPAKPR